jgi:hypothetical protein
LEQELNSTPKNSALWSRNSTMAEERRSLEQELISTQKNSAVWSNYSTTRQKNAAPWSRNSSQRIRTLLLGARTQPQAEERCSLEQELISTQKNSVL